MPDLKYTVATVSAGAFSREVQCSRRPSPKEINLLYVLCEHVNRIFEMDDICHRLKTTPNAVKILATRLRKKLSDEWAIDNVPNKGYRLLYFGGRLADATVTKTIMHTETMRFGRGPNRNSTGRRSRRSQRITTV